MAKESARFQPERGSMTGLVERCADALAAVYSTVRANTGADPALVYTESCRFVIRILALLIAAGRIPQDRSAAQPIAAASDAITAALENPSETVFNSFDDAVKAAHEASGLGIFAESRIALDAASLSTVARHLLRPHPDAPIERIYFETMPISWLGCVYQGLLAFRPDATGDNLEASRSYRKGRGVFYTPPCLITYITEGVLSPLIESRVATLDGAPPAERLRTIKVLDPSMGGGDFLSRAVDFLSDKAGDPDLRAELAANCVYGVDVDPGAVEVARFTVWAASAFADGISESIKSHLICDNALGARHEDEPPFDWASAFPEVFANSGGFDALVGNPPYIASKNGLRSARTSGQSDSYLMFLSAAMDNNLVRPGGLLSMVLPDPMLVRENAAPVRRKLMSEWTLLSLLHISEAFSDALVANVIPICRNTPPTGEAFRASRIERVGDRRGFFLRPSRTAQDLSHPVRRETVTAQDRCELLYLLEEGSFGEIIRRVHGDSIALSNYQEPFAPLRKLNVKAIYRGEEVGKSAIDRDNGDYPMLLGGQSVQPFEITWEGRKINRSMVKKPIERYLGTKILIQKSSARIVAALDNVAKKHAGYVFPQSVYAVELTDQGVSPYYLLCILNSQVMNEYIRRTVTGYKLLQPQLELEDIRALPIRRVIFTTHPTERERDVARGIDIFENESIRIGTSIPFPELANFTVSCLTGSPERSDVVHDILAHLGRNMVDLTRLNRLSPDSDTTRRLETTRSAIETIIWRLYSSEPAQMALPW